MSVGVRLAALDSCAVSDALDSLELSGVATGIAPMWQGTKCSGRVTTMKVVAALGARAPKHLGVEAIERSEAGDVIVVHQAPHDEIVSAAWGGLLALAASRKGVAGVIIDGNCRDVDEVRELGLPLFARGATPLTARRRYVEDSVGEPISVSGVVVNHGDYVVADATGLVFIPGARIEEVLDRAERMAAREALMAADVNSGIAASEVMNTNYEDLLDPPQGSEPADGHR